MSPETKKRQERQKDDLKWNTTNHRPTDSAIAKIEEFRLKIQDLGNWLIENTYVSREQSLALTDLENFTMHGVAGIARYETADIRNPK